MRPPPRRRISGTQAWMQAMAKVHAQQQVTITKQQALIEQQQATIAQQQATIETQQAALESLTKDVALTSGADIDSLLASYQGEGEERKKETEPVGEVQFIKGKDVSLVRF